MNSLEVLFAPAEFAALARRDLSQTVCVVFDILRATTSMVTALANGASGIIPVAEIPEALSLRQQRPGLLLAGERNGLRIRRDLTGSIDFDLGNSPREFTPEQVSGRMIAMTTTNGTRALRACAHAQSIVVGSFLNLSSLPAHLKALGPVRLTIVCAGTHEESSLEDTLAAGALCDLLLPGLPEDSVADSALMAREVYQAARSDLLGAMRHARNGRRLLAMPELAADVPFCLQRDTTALLATLHPDGTIRREN